MRIALFVAAISVVAACAASTTSIATSDGKLALGTWGGDTAGMIVQDTSVHVHVACTFGDVSGSIALDANNSFDVTGTYVLRAYPIAVGPMLPARFVGHLDGTTLAVSVTVNDTVEHRTVVLGPVSVTYLREPRMKNCPICRVPGMKRLFKTSAPGVPAV
jgi:hypothetical protein